MATQRDSLFNCQLDNNDPENKGLHQAVPCITCLRGDKERWMAIVYLLWRINNGPEATFNVNTVAKDCACYSCESEEDLFNDAIASLAQFGAAIDVLPDNQTPSVTQSAACLECEDELTLMRQAMCQFCKFLSLGPWELPVL